MDMAEISTPVRIRDVLHVNSAISDTINRSYKWV